jgi:hypothetical protein
MSAKKTPKKKSGKKRKMNPLFAKASKHCRLTTEPFSKAFGKCMKDQFAEAKKSK